MRPATRAVQCSCAVKPRGARSPAWAEVCVQRRRHGA
jgi:hypothetical protein